MSRILVFGEVIWDVYPDQAVIGGAPFNFAANLAQLGEETYLLTAVGADALGEAAREKMRQYGIRTDFVQTRPQETGQATVTLDENKVPRFFIHPDTAYDNIVTEDALPDALNALQADVFYFNTLIQRGAVSRKTLCTILETGSFREIFCDINIRKDCYDADSLERCLQHATILKMSEEDAVVLGADASPEALARNYPNLHTIALSCGEAGSCVYDVKTGQLYRSRRPQPEQVVSTVGAGDCYAAALLHGMLHQKSLPDAIEAATKRCDRLVGTIEAVLTEE